MFCADDGKGVATNSIWFVECNMRQKVYKKCGDLYKNKQQQ